MTFLFMVTDIATSANIFISAVAGFLGIVKHCNHNLLLFPFLRDIVLGTLGTSHGTPGTPVGHMGLHLWDLWDVWDSHPRTSGTHGTYLRRFVLFLALICLSRGRGTPQGTRGTLHGTRGMRLQELLRWL